MKKFLYSLLLSWWFLVYCLVQLFVATLLAPALQDFFAPSCYADFISNNLGSIMALLIAFANMFLANAYIEQLQNNNKQTIITCK